MESFKRVPVEVTASAMARDTPDKQQVPADEIIATAKTTENSELMSTLKQLVEKLGSLESAQQQSSGERGRQERERRSGRPRSPVRCWKCQELGHIA